jgi:hypothetical protein
MWQKKCLPHAFWHLCIYQPVCGDRFALPSYHGYGFGCTPDYRGQAFCLKAAPDHCVDLSYGSVLLAVLLALSRLSANSEIVAMKTGGLSFYRIAAPALVIGIYDDRSYIGHQ